MDSIKIHGYIGFSEINEDGSEDIKQLVENTVTRFGKEAIATVGLQNLFSGISAVDAGQNGINMNTIKNTANLDYATNGTYGIAVYLLNLTEAEKQALNVNSNLLPVYTSSFEIDSDKIVGYAYGTFTATEGKQGYLDTMEGERFINEIWHGLRFKWDADAMSGTFNTIAVGYNIMTSRFNGAAIYRGVEQNNPILGEKVSYGYMLRSGIKSSDDSIIITNDDEILLADGTEQEKARKVLNFTTGKFTLLDSTDYRYDIPVKPANLPQVFANNNLFYLSALNNGGLYRYDITTKILTTMISSGCYGIFIYNDKLYTNYNNSTLRAYTLTDFSRDSASDISISNINLPDFLSYDSNGYTQITNYGANFLVSKMLHTNAVNTKTVAVICSDIEDIAGSIIEILPNINTGSVYFINGKPYFFTYANNNTLTYVNQFKYLSNSGSSSTVTKNGVKFTTTGLFGNMLSFHTFDEDQQLTAGKAYRLNYFYSFE